MSKIFSRPRKKKFLCKFLPQNRKSLKTKSARNELIRHPIRLIHQQYFALENSLRQSHFLCKRNILTSVILSQLLNQGCQIFNSQTGKMYQMTTKYTKWP
jgi:hypothetical protein